MSERPSDGFRSSSADDGPQVVEEHEILRILDECARCFTFPVLDNGYVYPAASRLALFRSSLNWALVIEVFGYSPRAGVPDLCVYSFGDRLHDRRRPEGSAAPDADGRYLVAHPYNEMRFFQPIERDHWIHEEHVAADALQIPLRGRPVELPSISEYADAGILLSSAPRVAVFELCRWLAVTHREEVLGNVEEQRVNVTPGMDQLLVVDEWHHPDVAREELPSDTESFREFAQVLATRSPDRYRATEPSNTHWSNWPEGGAL